jgi:hypothetical protein
MGQEFEMYEITALTLMRNDARSECFLTYLRNLEQRARSMSPKEHWRKTAHDVVRFFCLFARATANVRQFFSC